ncbi:hypothetical protein ACFPRL_14460 [Pseudoclavibacter helvolus]
MASGSCLPRSRPSIRSASSTALMTASTTAYGTALSSWSAWSPSVPVASTNVFSTREGSMRSPGFN